MNDMTRVGIGHNGAPDPIDAICAQYEAERSEAENWTDGTPVENEAQMKQVDAIRKSMRDWRLALEAGQKSATAPLHDAYKAEGARWKPTIEDAQRIEKCLVAGVDVFKRKLAAEKEEVERLARIEANRKLREAQEAAEKAGAADLEAQRTAALAKVAAEEAQAKAFAASKDTVKGLRTVTRYALDDDRAALHDIAANDKPAMAAFIAEYVRLHHNHRQIAGVRVWQDKEAY